MSLTNNCINDDDDDDDDDNDDDSNYHSYVVKYMNMVC